MEALIVIGIVVVVLAIIVIALYNNLVQLRNRVDNAWSQIDVQLQRRLDLIPNLVETVKGYAAHESGTLQCYRSTRCGVQRFHSRAEDGGRQFPFWHAEEPVRGFRGLP